MNIRYMFVPIIISNWWFCGNADLEQLIRGTWVQTLIKIGRAFKSLFAEDSLEIL
jgi:hypothetical protein